MVHSNLEAIKSLAMQHAQNHGICYHIIILNPDASGKFSQEAGSTYEFVTDSYFEKSRDNVIKLYTTDDLFIRQEIKNGQTQNFKVETLEKEDIVECAHICDLNFKQLGYSYDVKGELEAQFATPKNFYTPEYVVFKYESQKFGKRILGVAGFSNCGWDSSIFGIYTCYVRPLFHRYGIGKLLTEERLKRIKEVGGEMVFSSTKEAWHLKRFGFEPINLMKGGWFLMQKVISTEKTSMEGMPRVQADKDGFVDCPYCKQKHRHGGNGNGVASGHRMPECGNQVGYIVVPFEEKG